MDVMEDARFVGFGCSASRRLGLDSLPRLNGILSSIARHDMLEVLA